MNEEILVEKLKCGDKDAFEALYEKYKKLAFHTAYLITGNQTDSEDVVQETFVKVYLHSNELKNNSGFKAWMMQILVRTAYHMCKKGNREFPDEEQVMKQDNRTEPSSLEQVMQKEETNELYAVIQKLPIKQRTVVILYYYNEYSIDEIAKLLGCMEGTVKSRLHTARKSMKKVLEGEKEIFL